MKNWIRPISIVPLVFAMTLLPLFPWQQGERSSQSGAVLPLLSIHRRQETTVSPTTITIEEANVPLASPVLLTEHSQYVPCTNGLLNYYSQGDSRWADEFYGPSDPMSSHGCGPAAVAMVVSSFTGSQVTPLDVAVWASDNGYCAPGEGSKHELIPDALAHYNLTVTSLPDRTVDTIVNTIKSGKIVVALMNQGHFTNGGHFLLLTQVTEDGKIRIADSASWENSSTVWDPAFLLSEVRKKAEGGGPLWAVEMPPEV